LLEELIGYYRVSAQDSRHAVHKLFEKYRAFAWAPSLPFDPTTEEAFRRHLVPFSMKDQAATVALRG